MISAVIFDLDGTVLANEDEYGVAFTRVLKKLGKNADSDYPHIGGIGVRENWPQLLSKYKIRTKKTVEELTKETQDAYLNQLNKVELKPGFVLFAGDLRENGIKTALATSNDWWIMNEVFNALKLNNFFDVTTTGEEVASKKPAPDLFLITADKLGIAPEECLVIEDSKAGIEAAHSAGMKTIGIARDDEHAHTLKGANEVVFNYSELSLARINNLV